MSLAVLGKDLLAKADEGSSIGSENLTIFSEECLSSQLIDVAVAALEGGLVSRVCVHFLELTSLLNIAVLFRLGVDAAFLVDECVPDHSVNVFTFRILVGSMFVCVDFAVHDLGLLVYCICYSISDNGVLGDLEDRGKLGFSLGVDFLSSLELVL